MSFSELLSLVREFRKNRIRNPKKAKSAAKKLYEALNTGGPFSYWVSDRIELGKWIEENYDE